MAYTPLTTQVAGGTASAAGWANVVKANFEAMGPHLIVRKSADESVANSTTTQDDNELLLPVGASEVWLIRYVLKYTQPSILTGIRIDWTFPSGGEMTFTGYGFNTDTTPKINQSHATTSPSPQQMTFGGQTLTHVAPIDGMYIGGGTAGTLTLRWAQLASNASPTVVKANSTLWGVKLA